MTMKATDTFRADSLRYVITFQKLGDIVVSWRKRSIQKFGTASCLIYHIKIPQDTELLEGKYFKCLLEDAWQPNVSIISC